MAHQYSCSACAFQVRSGDDDELISLVREHARDKHGMGVSEADVRGGWESVAAEADD